MNYDVPLVPQETGMSCWAASIAMVKGWGDNASYDQAAIARNIGGTDYTPSMANGLNPNDKNILQRNGFHVEPPMCYTQGRVLSLLQQHGPLWVASAVPTPHIRVITGMSGNMLYVNDPWPPGEGDEYMQSFEEFFGAMESLGGSELSEPDPVYVAYLE